MSSIDALTTTRSAAALPKLSCRLKLEPCALSALVTSSSLRWYAVCARAAGFAGVAAARTRGVGAGDLAAPPTAASVAAAAFALSFAAFMRSCSRGNERKSVKRATQLVWLEAAAQNAR